MVFFACLRPSLIVTPRSIAKPSLPSRMKTKYAKIAEMGTIWHQMAVSEFVGAVQ